MAGGYNNTENYPHWNNFEPHPLPSGLKNKALIQGKIHQIPNVEWIKLQNEVKKLETPYKEGYYPIDVQESDWNKINLEQVKWI